MSVLVDGEIVLYGFVGDDMWDEGFTDRQVLDALAELGRDSDVTVRLNSGGGFTDAGKAVFNALRAHPGHVTVSVDGIAASAASIIAMAGDEIVMRSGALMMIHDASAMTIGNAEDHRKSSDWLDIESAALASIYAERTGRPAEEMRALMRAETWMSAEDAVAAGFATRADSARARSVAAFDYRAYAHAPERLKRAARKKNWSFETPRAAASASVEPRPEKEIQVTEKSTAEESTATQAPVAQAPAVPDLEAVERAAEARATARAAARASEIADLCALAGVSSTQALAYVSGTMSPAEIRKDLLKARAAADETRAINSQIPQPAKAAGGLAARQRQTLGV